MTKEEWDAKQNGLKKTYQFLPTGNAGEVEKKEIDPRDYETELPLEQEKKFQSWLDKYHQEKKIPDGDYQFYKQNGYGYGYDFRAAYKAGLKPQISKVDNEWHWGDFGKKPNHESFSNESKYYTTEANPGVGGYWGGDDGEEFIKNPSIGAPIPPTKEVYKKLKK